MKVWITKYALTAGIEAVEVEASSISQSMVVACRQDTWGGDRYFHGEGKDWHRTPEAAIAHAEKMRAAKIASLRKQISKLEKLTFEARP